jgi:alcohol dehydrogenase (cytochrome c)
MIGRSVSSSPKNASLADSMKSSAGGHRRAMAPRISPRERGRYQECSKHPQALERRQYAFSAFVLTLGGSWSQSYVKRLSKQHTGVLMRNSLWIAGWLLAFAGAASGASVDWGSYNRTLTSERFAPLKQINPESVKQLQVLCTYDTHETTSFQSGLLQVNGALYWTTEHDTFSVDPDTCLEKWRDHEDFPRTILPVNRGVAYLEGRVFRGSNTGRVIAYEAATGRRLWSTPIADPARGELITAAPIAWDGRVYIGIAGGDIKGVKGRMYALEAASGKILWEFFLVPRQPGDPTYGPAGPGSAGAPISSWKNDPDFPINGGCTWTSYTIDPVKHLLYVPVGNPAPDFVNEFRGGSNLYTGSVVVLDAVTGSYRRHFQLVQRDFHDWDVSAAPALFKDARGRSLMAVTPKDGHLYALDLGSGALLYRHPMTTLTNATLPLTPQGVRFCPGTQGGAEWNGPAYDPLNNTLLVGEVDWCSTVHTDPRSSLQAVPLGRPWSGSRDGFGQQDDTHQWAGWVSATDASRGTLKWRFRTPYPVLSGVTATAGGLVLVADMGGTLYALDTQSGTKLWSTDLGAAVGGGVITYDTGAGQRIAVATGMNSPIWPAPKATAKVVVLGLK